MATLVRGWFDDDGGFSHAVDLNQPHKSLCGKLDPLTRNDIDDPWDTAPFPLCQRCQQAWAVRPPEGPPPISIVMVEGNVTNSTIQSGSPGARQEVSYRDLDGEN